MIYGRSRIDKVFPTGVGVFLRRDRATDPRVSLPHGRGGVSTCYEILKLIIRSSPRAWGCFCALLLSVFLWKVFPTGVGVFLIWRNRTLRRYSLPHGRGGVSPPEGGKGRAWTSSPRAWGCFWIAKFLMKKVKVFPTGVGVFLGDPTLLKAIVGLPHGRGGVSGGVSAPESPRSSSPRAWGCF